LVVGHYHLVPPAALIIGPPLALLTSAALIFGFLLIPTAVVCGPLVPVWARLTSWSLGGCEEIVGWADLPASFRWYGGGCPDWWLCGFYLGLCGALALRALRVRWRWFVAAGAAWLCVGLAGGSARPTPDEFRCTFLAVGHGGCTVLETPDGRTLLYDAGALAGSEVTRLKIAPFLWHRGIRRIDEVLLSHADLDHFNGLPALLERFPVVQGTCTPTFRDKATPGVRRTLAALEQHGIPMRTVRAGDRLSAGDVAMEVLHPPANGPEGNENARSLVLLVRHAGHVLLLTGDLEG